MGRSLSFGSTSDDDKSPIQTRFRYGSVSLTMPWKSNSLVSLCKRHAVTGTRSLLRPLVSTRFQVLFHSPFRGTFHLSLTVLFTIGRQGVLSLAGWPPQLPTGFPVPGRTQEPDRKAVQLFRLRDCHPLWCGFPAARLTHDFVTSRPAGRRIKAGPTTPCVRQRLPSITPRFGLFPLRSPLLRESRFLSFLGLLRCFSSPAYRLPPYVFRLEHARITTRRFPHSEIPGSKVGQHLPGLIAAAHVLHRLLAPRHPPCALILLIEKNTCVATMEFSKCRRARPSAAQQTD